MGGRGSGRFGARGGRTTQEAWRLDLRKLRRAGFPEQRSGEVVWAAASRRARAKLILIDGALILEGPDFRAQVVKLEWTTTAIPGQRPWFTCPCCDRRCLILYRPWEARDALFACRKCHALTYPSQRQTRYQRLRAAHWRLADALGARSLEGIPARPKGMRQDTYAKQMRRWQKLAQDVDDAAMDELMSMLGVVRGAPPWLDQTRAAI